MSFVSSSKSLLVPVLANFPTANPNAIGYVEEPNINNATGTQNASLNAFIRPISKGVWLLSGVLIVQANTGDVTGVALQIFLNDIPFQLYQVAPPAGETDVPIPISAVVTSNAILSTDILRLNVTVSTTTGTWRFLKTTRTIPPQNVETDLIFVGTDLKLVRLA